MASPIKVGSGYIDVVPRLNNRSITALKNRLNREMALAGGNSGRAMGAALTSSLSSRVEKEMRNFSRTAIKQARSTGTDFGTSFMRAFNRVTDGKIVFADKSTIRANNRAHQEAGKTAGESYTRGFSGAAKVGEQIGREAKAAQAHMRDLESISRNHMRSFQDAMEGRKRALRDDAANITNLTNTIRRSGEETDRLLRQSSRLSTNVRGSLGNADKIIGDVDIGLKQIYRGLQETEVRTNSLARAMVGFGKSSNSEIRQVSESLRMFSNRLQGFGQDWALFITAPIVASTGAMTAWGLQVGAELQKARLGIQRLAEVAGYDLADATNLASAQLADIREFAEDTTFEFAPLANGVQRLMAAGLEAETATHWIKSLGDTTAAYGAGADEMNRAIIAVSQSMAAGKIYAQDMNQLHNAGIPIWRMMAEATGQTEAELRALGQSGELLSDDVWPQLIEYMDESHEGIAKLMAQEIPLYAWGNAMEAFQNALGDLISGTDSTMEVVNEQRPKMWISLFETLEETLTRIVPIMGQVLDKVVPVLDSALQRFNSFLDRITDSEGEVNNFALGMGGIATVLGPAMIGIGFIGRGIASMISAMRALPQSVTNLSDLIEKLESTSRSTDKVSEAAEGTSDSFDGVSGKARTFRERLTGLSSYLGDAGKSGWASGTALADKWGENIVGASKRTVEFGKNISNSIRGGVSRATESVFGFADKFTEKLNTVGDAIERAEPWNKFIGMMSSIEPNAKHTFKVVSERVSDFWKDVRDGSAWDRAKENIKQFGVDARENITRVIDRIKEIPGTIRVRYEEAGGISGIAQKGMQAAGKGAAAAGRGIMQTMRGAMGAIGALVNIIGSVLGPIMKTLQKTLGGTLDALGKALEPLGKAFADAILPALTTAVVALTPAILAFTPVMEKLGEALGPVIEVLAEEFSEIMGELAPVFTELINELSPFLSELGSFVGEILGMLAPILGELLIALAPVITMIAGAFMQALEHLLPILVSILEAVSPLIPQIGEFLMQAIELITPIIEQLFEAIEPLIPVIGELLMSAIEIIVPLVVMLFEAIEPLIPVLVTLLEAFLPLIEALMPIIELAGILIGLLLELIGPVIKLASVILEWIIEKALVPLIEWIGKVIGEVSDYLGPVFEWVAEEFVDFTETVVDKFNSFKKKWDRFWDGLGSKAREIYEDWIEPVIDGVGKAWDTVAGLFSGDPDEAPKGYSTGGVVPGYAPGVDIVPALLSPGEGILRPEVVNWLGKSTINRWNSGAMRGDIPKFASGGIVGSSKAAQDGASAVLSGPVLATPVPEVGKMLDELADEYEDTTGDISTDWVRSADKITSTTYTAMDDVNRKSRSSMNQLSGSIIRPNMDKASSYTRTGMRGMVSETSSGWSSIVNTTKSRTSNFVSTVQRAARDASRHWSSMISDINRTTRGMVNTSYSRGVVGVLSQMSSLAGVRNPLSPVRLSTGGILPGYQPGVDTIPAILSAGEAVLRPEVVKMLGPEIINEWNRSARAGEIRGYADGGIVDGASWVRRNKDKPYEGYKDAFKAAVREVIDPSLRHFASYSGGYGTRAQKDVQSGFSGIEGWLKKVDKAANSGGNAAKVVEVLQKEHRQGVSGRPNKYGPAEPWCANFVSWVVDKAKANKAYWNSPKGTPGNRWPAVATWESVSARAGDYRSGTSGIRPGDIVTYGGGGQHINIVEKVLGGGRFQTIGGNESDSVRRQIRTSARGYGRPRWGLSGSGASSGPFKGINVKAWPGSFSSELATDGGGVDRYLARGAVVHSPTRAVIGEAGPEAVIPLTDRERTATLLEEIGLPHKEYNINIDAAPDVPTEETILKALGYADTIYR